MQEIETVQKAVNWASRKLLRFVSHGKLPTEESVDVMAAEFAGDACEKFALDHSQWSDHLWEMLRMAGRKRLRGIGRA
jgi:hypothetical protein